MTTETLESELRRVLYVTPHARSIRDLSISVTDDTITLQGRATTYYQKQVIQHAILNYLETHRNNGLAGRQFRLLNAVTVFYPEKRDD